MVRSAALDSSLAQLEEQLAQTLNMVVAGRVSTGKSSLTNALLRRTREDPVVAVGAESGVTTELKALQFDDRVRVIDSPGLDDVDEDRSGLTEDFLRRVDVGLLVVTGSADATQVAHLRRLEETCEQVFVVLNKVDHWDRHGPDTVEEILAQWREALGVDRVYPTCTFGYDPELPDGTALDLRGVDELREELERILGDKALQLARHMAEKLPYAQDVIARTLKVCADTPLLRAIPAVVIGAQVRAICELNVLYTGRTLGRSEALALLPVVARNAPLVTALLWFPPLGPLWLVLAPLARRLRSTLVFSLLSAVQWALAARQPLERPLISRRFRVSRHLVRRRIAAGERTVWQEPLFWRSALVDLSRPQVPQCVSPPPSGEQSVDGG
jgi:GTP-binding protein EngB required for normal cell division